MLNAFDFSAIEEMDPSLGKYFYEIKNYYFWNKPNILFDVRQYDYNSRKLFINFIATLINERIRRITIILKACKIISWIID